MLKIPPGIEKRSGSSKIIEQAGAAFDSLYKKHFSSEQVQKQAENYLLKSLYNKTVLKQKAAPAPTEPLTDADPEHAPVDISRLVDFYQSLPASPKAKHRPHGKPGKPAAKSGNHVSFEHGSRLVRQRQLSSDSLGSGSDLGPRDSAHRPGSPSPLELSSAHPPKSDHLSSTSPSSPPFADNFSDVSEEAQGKNYIRFQKHPLQDKQNEEPLDEFFNEPPHGKQQSYYHGSLCRRRDAVYVCTICVLLQSLLFVTLLTAFLLLNARLVSKPVPDEPAPADGPAAKPAAGAGAAAAAGEPKEPGSPQALRGAHAAAGAGAQPGGGVAAADSADPVSAPVARPRAAFLATSFPFALHFVLFYLVFWSSDAYLRRKQLLYSNDVSLEVVTRRLNRELSFAKLNTVTFWFDKGVLALAVIIACLPFSGTYNLRSWGKSEFVYLALVIIFFILHVAYSLYYFNFKFVHLVLSEKQER